MRCRSSWRQRASQRQVWTLYLNTDPSKPPQLPFFPRHNVNAFMEDYIHDWNVRVFEGQAYLDYYSRVADRPVWVLLEYRQ